MFRKCVASLACAAVLSACAGGPKLGASPAKPTIDPRATPTNPSAQATNPTKAWIAAAQTHLLKYERATLWRGEVDVNIQVDRRGHVVWTRILKSSGIASLDREALSILERAGPLPPPPPEVAGETIALTAHFQFYGKSGWPGA
jgi:protein TonB